jgi:hypothetical protein
MKGQNYEIRCVGCNSTLALYFRSGLVYAQFQPQEMEKDGGKRFPSSITQLPAAVMHLIQVDRQAEDFVAFGEGASTRAPLLDSLDDVCSDQDYELMFAHQGAIIVGSFPNALIHEGIM